MLRRLSGDDFSEREIQRLRSAFDTNAIQHEIHVDDLSPILDFLGYLKISHGELQSLIAEIVQYSTVTFDEFLEFMRKINEVESAEFHKCFNSFDEDGSGELDAGEMGKLLKSLGITPFKSTMNAALAIVDEDGTGSLCFDEFVQLLMTYRKTEGFSQDEVTKLFRVFIRFAGDVDGFSLLKADKLQDALLSMFGSQVASLACKLAEQQLAGGVIHRPASRFQQKGKTARVSVLSVDSAEPKGMRFREFVVWARRLREAEVESYRQAFSQHDADGGGVLDPDEIRSVLAQLGYTPLNAVIYDLIATFDSSGDGSLDFNEFVNMMQLFRSTDGFTRDELGDLKEVFTEFDTKHDGEINVVEVGSMLRCLGFETEHNKAEAMLRTVDWNGSNSLDFSEFLRLMRLHREEGLQQVRKVFSNYANTVDMDAMESDMVPDALTHLGFPKSTSKAIVNVFQTLCSDFIDFDGLVGVVDACRRVVIRKHRKNAGYSATKLVFFKRQFQNLDTDKSGELQADELVEFCNSTNDLTLATKEDQMYLMDLIQQARVAARATGLSEEECGKKLSKTVTWYVFVHLQRVLQTHADRRAAALLHSEQGHQYAKVELETFKDLFAYAVKRQELEEPIPSGCLALEGLWPIFRRMGLNLMQMQREQVKMRLFKDNKGQTQYVDFEAFIRLAWWIEKSDIFRAS